MLQEIHQARVESSYFLDFFLKKSFSPLIKANPDDVAVLAELIGAYASFDSARAAKESEKLPSLETLTEGVNVDDIELWAKRLGYNKERVEISAEFSKLSLKNFTMIIS